MTDPMTDARLAEIARVHASVDRFPFTSDRYAVLDVDGDWITDSYGLFWTEELAEFVALSSTAVPELLAEVRRIRAVADAAHAYRESECICQNNLPPYQCDTTCEKRAKGLALDFVLRAAGIGGGA